MATEQTILYLAVCDGCGMPNNDLWPGFEFEDEAEEQAIEECYWHKINDELLCTECY